MDDWGIIEYGFNTADETLNFGTRNLACGENLYEACTLASLRRGQAESSSVDLRAITKAGRIYLSLDNTIKIFANVLCNELTSSLCFDETIDAYCVTDDGKFVIICLRNGIVHCIDAEDGNKVVFSKCIFDDDENNTGFVDCFVERYAHSFMSILVAVSDGKVFRLPFEFDDERSDADEEVTSDLIVDFDCFIKSTSFNGSVVLADGEKLCVYDVPCGQVQTCDSLNLKQIYPYNNSLFISIDEHGNLIQICPVTLLTLRINTDDVLFESFVFVRNPSGTSQVLALTKPADSSEPPKIRAFTYPGFTLLFSLAMNDAVRLIRPENVHDEYMYVSLLKATGGGATEEVRILQVVDTAPENRLKRMLRRGKFDEALAFARIFNLDVADVRKAKAESIVEKLICTGEDVRQLLAILRRIEGEIGFKIRCCLNAFRSCEDLDDVREVLNYGCLCLTSYTQPEDVDEEFQELTETISETTDRLETYVLIRKQGDYDVEWEEFSEGDLFDLVCASLQKHDVEQAVIIYSRMNSACALKLDEHKLQTVLGLLNNLSLNACTSFLFSFLPVALSRAPGGGGGALPALVNWLRQKLFSIESAYGEKFPQNALDFLDVFLRILNLDSLSVRDLDPLMRGALDELVHMMKSLKSLRSLKESYSIVVPLKDYLKSPRSLIGTLLLVQLNERTYEEFLGGFLCNFMLENHFRPDDVFLEEICGLVEHQERYWIKILPSILRCVNSVEVKLNAVVKVLENADVPWCEAVREIARNSLKYDRPGLVNIIREKIKNEPNQVVLRRPKYNFPNDVSISEDLPFIIGRLIYCKEPTLVDDAFQLCIDSDQTIWVATRLMDGFVRSGDVSSVVTVLNKMKPAEMGALCSSAVDLIECYDHLKPVLPEKIVQNYPLVLNLLLRRNPVERTDVAESLEACKNFLKLKANFHPDVRSEQMRDPKLRRRLLDSILSNVAGDFSRGALSAGESMKRCSQISALLGVSETNVTLGFCGKLNGLDAIVEFVDDAMCLDESSSENLCLMAVLIMRSVDSLGSLQLDGSFGREGGGAFTKIDTYSLGFELAQKLSVRAILKSKADDVAACVPVYNWVMSTFFSRNNSTTDLSERCRPLKSPGFGTFRSFRFVFDAFARLAVGCKNPDLRYLTHFGDQVDRLSEEQFARTVERLPTLINNLCLEGQSLTASKLIVTLMDALANIDGGIPKTRDSLYDILINRCVPQVLQKLFSARDIDVECAYILLVNYKCRDPLKEIRNYLQVNKRNAQKLATLAKLALRIIKHQGIGTNEKDYVKIVLLSKWWGKIGECRLSMKEFFTTASKIELLSKLIEHGHLNLEMLAEFCADFDLCPQTSYVAYLKGLLTNWTPRYRETIEDERGETKITVENDEEELFKACEEVVELIDDKRSVEAAVNTFYHAINFYHYEVFMCVLKIWRMLKINVGGGAKNTMLLIFLRTYGRVRPPGNLEVEEWFSTFPNSRCIDPLSQWRLPFTRTLFTKDVWKIIRPELNLKTYATWFDVVRILDGCLNKNDICIYVVKEVVSSGALRGEPRPFYSARENLFEEIDACVGNITDYEKAASAVYHLLTQTPEGIDQVIAAKLCLKYARRYKEHCSESDPTVLDAFKKVMYKYLYISGSHIMRKHKLTDDEYTKMLPRSHELIAALYMDPRLLRKTHDRPDINKAVDELGALFEIDVREKRVQLLEGYLSESCFGLNWPETNEGCESTAENNIKRASYICESGEPTHWRNFLFEKGFCDGKSLSFRANALRCLCAISDPESVEALTNTPYNAFVNYVEKVSLLGQLESLGSSIDVEQLDKHRLVLLKRLSQDLLNPLSIKAMTSICVLYEVHDLQHWEKIIDASISLKLHRNLRNCLKFLKTVGNIKRRKIYVDAWQTVIDHSFDVLAPNNKEDVYDACIENVLLLQSCPVLFALDLKKAFKSYCELQRFEFAAVVLQYLQEEDRFDCVKKILQSNKENLQMDIKRLSMRGIWGTSSVLNLMCSVIDSSTIE